MIQDLILWEAPSDVSVVLLNGSWKLGKKQWPIFNEVEIPELPWQAVEEGVKRLREVGMCLRQLEWL